MCSNVIMILKDVVDSGLSLLWRHSFLVFEKDEFCLSHVG